MKILTGLTFVMSFLLFSTGLFAQDAGQTHTVKKNETLSHIAIKYNTSVEDLKTANNLKSDLIRRGQELTIPKLGVHIVNSGESLFGISQSYNQSVNDLKKWNNLTSDVIQPNQQLRVLASNDLTSNDLTPKGGVPREFDANIQSPIHVVNRKETLYKIAKKYGLEINDLKSANNLSDNNINKGDRLVLPLLTHTVLANETLNKIAKRYSVTVQNLKTANGLKNNTILIGQNLVIPG